MTDGTAPGLGSGGVGRRMRPVLQPGNLVNAVSRARLRSASWAIVKRCNIRRLIVNRFH